MVYYVFESLEGLLLKVNRDCIDNKVFRLHYKASVIFLAAFSFLVTYNQLLGEPIDCIYR